MREFSKNEQKIIREKLIDGAVFTEIFSSDFLDKSKFEIEIDKEVDGFSRYQFVSEVYTPEEGNKELVNVINLLQFLLANGLITKYPPIGFNSLGETDLNFTLGKAILTPGRNSKVKRTLLAGFPKEIDAFILTYWFYRFEATEPLKSLAAHNFQSQEVRMHNTNVRLAIIGNVVAVLIAFGGIYFAYDQNSKSYDDLNFKVGKLESEFNSLVRIKKQDSISQMSHRAEIDSLKKEIKGAKTIKKTK